MAGANSNIQVADLDFNSIKKNLIKFLQGNTVLQDYNFEGSALSTLLDVLAYNTQYNSYYLNMVANEMFLDTAILRPSVVSHAKLLDYTPKSNIAPTAIINLNIYGVTKGSLTLPAYTRFLSEAINGINYTFVTTDSYTVNTNLTTNIASFNNIPIKQGLAVSQTYSVDSTTNPNYIFEIPDQSVDTTTLLVTVQQNSSNSYSETYNLAVNYLTLTGDSKVYFLQEGTNGHYQIYFGNGILGSLLPDGAVVKISYITTQGPTSAGANNFTLTTAVGGYSQSTVQAIFPASTGGSKESIDSIKFQAPKSYAAQGRAITKEDYITLIQQNQLGFSFDAVSVWGGEENNPPTYGQIYISLKPSGAYNLTTTQKQRILNEIVKPIGVLTVSPVIIDPDYTYIQISTNVLYSTNKTNYTSAQLQALITQSIQNFATSTLNTFNSTFNGFLLQNAIQSTDASIVTSEYSIKLQKKFYPNLTTAATYILTFGVPLQRGVLLNGISISPALQYKDPANPNNIIDGVYIEEVPQITQGVASISIINPGYSYKTAPTVTIVGDGEGATAVAAINSNGQLTSITITNAGTNYTSAVVVIKAVLGDTGQNASAVATLQGQFGNLRTYYITNQKVKTILNSNIGTVDYTNGIVTLNSFNPYQIDNPLGELTLSVNPTTTIISSTYNKIITVDPFDPLSVIVNVSAQS